MVNKPGGRKLPRFENLPINETVYGVVFSRLPDFKVPHLGLLWDQYRKEYPKCEEVPRLLDVPADKPGEPTYIFDQWNIPRIWFIHSDDSRVIQVQNDRFFYNWRRREKNYPNYDIVFPEFKIHFETFLSFVQDHHLGVVSPKSLELTYINQIPMGGAWKSLSEISNLFPDISWRRVEDRFLPNPQHLSANLGFLLPEGKGTLIASIQHGNRTPDGVQILILQLSAKGPPESNEPKEFLTWFDLAHAWIVRGFEDRTSTDVQHNIWGKI